MKCVSPSAHWDDEHAVSSPGGGSSRDSGDSCHDNRPFYSSPPETTIRGKQEMIKVEDSEMAGYSSVLFSPVPGVVRRTPGTLILCRDAALTGSHDDKDGSPASLSGLSSPGSDRPSHPTNDYRQPPSVSPRTGVQGSPLLYLSQDRELGRSACPLAGGGLEALSRAEGLRAFPAHYDVHLQTNGTHTHNSTSVIITHSS